MPTGERRPVSHGLRMLMLLMGRSLSATVMKPQIFSVLGAHIGTSDALAPLAPVTP